MSAMAIRGAKLPPAAGPPVYDVIDVRAGQLLDVTVLGEEILGTSCHWLGAAAAPPRGRSRACEQWRRDCEWHVHRAIWQGFLAVYNHGEKRRDVLRLGPVGARAVLAHSVQHFGLRGVRLNLTKCGASVTAGITAVAAREQPLLPLIAAHDVTATVLLVLGTDALPDPLGPGGYANPPAETCFATAGRWTISRSRSSPYPAS